MSDSLEKQTLEETLRQAASGDESAWRIVVESYAPRVFGLLRANCNNVDLAEEITQSTFCTIVEKLPGYTELGRFESWLFRIAVNRLRDELRRRQRQAAPVEESTLHGLAGAGGAGEAVESAEDSTSELGRLRDAIGKLSDREQRVIHLRHYGSVSFKQISDILDEPIGTVLARYHRAREKLKRMLVGGPGDTTDRSPS